MFAILAQRQALADRVSEPVPGHQTAWGGFRDRTQDPVVPESMGLLPSLPCLIYFY